MKIPSRAPTKCVLESGWYQSPYDFHLRMGDGNGTNPEELLGSAHADWFSMTLELELPKVGFSVQHLHTRAKVHFEERECEWSIHRIWSRNGSTRPRGGSLRRVRVKKKCPVPRAVSRHADIHFTPNSFK